VGALRILVSNDDGIGAPGIQALALALADCHEVYVVAPDRERSATGHALTLHRPLRAEHYELGDKIRAAWAVSGTPSDCIKLALGTLLEAPPDLVVSGINRGPNLGTDVLYSGTVSAALEAVINGVPAVAFSLTDFVDAGYEPCAAFARELVAQLPIENLPEQCLLNVNFPFLEAGGAYHGVRVTRLGRRKYRDRFEHRTDLRGRTFYWLAGEAEEQGEHPASDVVAIQEGYVTITPIQYDMTRYTLLDTVREWNVQLQSQATAQQPGAT
jgi:5'-nucleotidase